MKQKTLCFLVSWFVLSATSAFITSSNTIYHAHISTMTPVMAAIHVPAPCAIPTKLFTRPVRQWMDTLAMIESTNNYKAVSRSGSYVGRYQIGAVALRSVGEKHISKKIRQFRRNPNVIPPHLQDKLVLKLAIENRRILKSDIKKYAGKRIKGIRITETSIIGAAHGGPGRVKSFLRSNGRCDSRDGNGTRVSSYLRRFARNPPVNFERVSQILLAT